MCHRKAQPWNTGFLGTHGRNEFEAFALVSMDAPKIAFTSS
ncbi:hypothetical protein C900_04335 [Fulvivirga imtechensis AK7]|uniref:Uncharacterized protein n=1 Tax=Fulvivirga imtechensis AK7 TaxID=1237149 RepID=L8JZ88_9BACT|nr:hypothetical protein C900_04335 [Fulvivirga imtechensis AK7]